MLFRFFFFNDTATTEIYTLSLHDALPISLSPSRATDHHGRFVTIGQLVLFSTETGDAWLLDRSEEHTSELQSPDHLVCRLLLEKKKKNKEKCSQVLLIRCEPSSTQLADTC